MFSFAVLVALTCSTCDIHHQALKRRPLGETLPLFLLHRLTFLDLVVYCISMEVVYCISMEELQTVGAEPACERNEGFVLVGVLFVLMQKCVAVCCSPFHSDRLVVTEREEITFSLATVCQSVYSNSVGYE